MHVLLLGANGQVGREIVRSADPFDVSLDAPGRSAIDLSRPGQITDWMDERLYDGVINAAAYTAVDDAEKNVPLAQVVNAAAPGELASACARADIPLVHYSTDYVFGGTANRPLTEQDPTEPLGTYGRTKLAGEIAIGDSGCVHAIIRLSWVFSAHGRNFVKTMLSLAQTRDSVSVVADQCGKPTPAAQAARAGLVALHALGRNRDLTGTYHFAGRGETSWAGFAQAIFELAGANVDVQRIATKDYPTPAKRPAYSVLDTRRFSETFGIEPPSWRDELKTVIEELGH